MKKHQQKGSQKLPKNKFGSNFKQCVPCKLTYIFKYEDHCCKCKISFLKTCTHCCVCKQTYDQDFLKNHYHCNKCCVTTNINESHCCECRKIFNKTKKKTL